jgi:hypothetical protein
VALAKAIVVHSAVKWSDGEADATKVAEILVQVNTVRTEGEIELGERGRRIKKQKRIFLEGRNPDLEERVKQMAKKKKMQKKANNHVIELAVYSCGDIPTCMGPLAVGRVLGLLA